MSGKHDKKLDDEQSAKLLLTGPIVIRGLGRSVKDALLPGKPSRHRAFVAGGTGDDDANGSEEPTPIEQLPAADATDPDDEAAQQVADAPVTQESDADDARFPSEPQVAQTEEADGPREDRMDDRGGNDAPVDEADDARTAAGPSTSEESAPGETAADVAVEPQTDRAAPEDVAADEVAEAEEHVELLAESEPIAESDDVPRSEDDDDAFDESAAESESESESEPAVDFGAPEEVSSGEIAEAEGRIELLSESESVVETAPEGDDLPDDTAAVAVESERAAAADGVVLDEPEGAEGTDEVLDANGSAGLEIPVDVEPPQDRADSDPVVDFGAADPLPVIDESAEPSDEVRSERGELDQLDELSSGAGEEQLHESEGSEPVVPITGRNDADTSDGDTADAQPVDEGLPESLSDDAAVADEGEPGAAGAGSDETTTDGEPVAVEEQDASVAAESESSEVDQYSAGAEAAREIGSDAGPTSSEPGAGDLLDDFFVEESDASRDSEDQELPLEDAGLDATTTASEGDFVDAEEPRPDRRETEDLETGRAVDDPDESGSDTVEPASERRGGPLDDSSVGEPAALRDGEEQEPLLEDVPADDADGGITTDDAAPTDAHPVASEAAESAEPEPEPEFAPEYGSDEERVAGSHPETDAVLAEFLGERKWTTAEELFSRPITLPTEQDLTAEAQASSSGPDERAVEVAVETMDSEPLEPTSESSAEHDATVEEPEPEPEVEHQEPLPEPEPEPAVVAAAVAPVAVAAAARPAPKPERTSRPPRRARPIRERFGREAIGIAVLVVLALVCGGLIAAVVLKTQRDAAVAAQEAANYTPPPLATPSPTATGPVVAVIGDGTTSTAASGVTTANKWSALLGTALDGTVTADASSGMGYAAKGSSGETFAQAAAKVPSNADVVIFFGGAEDSDISTLSLAKAATGAFSAAKTQAPDAKIIVVGPAISAGVADADLTSIRNILHTSAGVVKATWIDPIDAKWLSASKQSASSPSALTAADEKTLATKFEAAVKKAVG